MIEIPEFTGTTIEWIVLGFALAAPLMFIVEATGIFSLGYSKFARREQRWSLPSRVGMLIIYFPAVVLFPIVLIAHGVEWTPWHMLTAALMSLHFLKRCAETLWVHKYSGVMNGWSVAFICVLYSMVSALLGEFAARIPPETAAGGGYTRWAWLGIAVWITGTLINGYHHVLLARLREPGEVGYKLPRGGLFVHVACPHYFGELVAWLGYALVFHHAAAFCILVTMTGYLMGRSHNTVKWYRKRVDGVPENWKRILPFVY